MSSLRPCPTCRRHIEQRERVCPFCAATLPADFHALRRPPPRRATSRAALLFLGAVTGEGLACKPEGKPSPPQRVAAVPPYSVAPVQALPEVAPADAGAVAGGAEASAVDPVSAQQAKRLTQTPDRVAAVPPYSVAPIRREAPYVLTVTVVDARKRPVAGATVSVGGEGPPVMTNAKGEAALRLPAGPSELRVSRDRLEATQAIDATGDLKVRVVLKKAR